MYNFAEGYTNESLAKELGILLDQFLNEEWARNRGGVPLNPASCNANYHNTLRVAIKYLREKDAIRSAAEMLITAELFRRDDFDDTARDVWRFDLAKALFGENDPRIKALLTKHRFKRGDWVCKSHDDTCTPFLILKIDRNTNGITSHDCIYFHGPLTGTLQAILSFNCRLATPEEIKKAQDE